MTYKHNIMTDLLNVYTRVSTRTVYKVRSRLFRPRPTPPPPSPPIDSNLPSARPRPYGLPYHEYAARVNNYNIVCMFTATAVHTIVHYAYIITMCYAFGPYAD